MYERGPMNKRERIKLIASVLNAKQDSVKARLQEMKPKQRQDFLAMMEREQNELQQIAQTPDPESVLIEIAQTFEKYGLASSDEFPPVTRGSITSIEVADDPEIRKLLEHTCENLKTYPQFVKQLDELHER